MSLLEAGWARCLKIHAHETAKSLLDFCLSWLVPGKGGGKISSIEARGRDRGCPLFASQLAGRVTGPAGFVSGQRPAECPTDGFAAVSEEAMRRLTNWVPGRMVKIKKRRCAMRFEEKVRAAIEDEPARKARLIKNKELEGYIQSQARALREEMEDLIRVGVPPREAEEIVSAELLTPAP